jgi:acylaminoacyl-peptidase
MPRVTSRWRGAVLAALLTPALAAQRKPFSPSDLWEWREVTQIRITPDGKTAVYVESRRDRAADAAYSNLWAASTDGRERHPLTTGDWRDWSPRWASDPPEGAQILAYLTNRTGRTQIRARRLAASQDSQAGDLEQPPLAIALSPAGDAIAYTAMAPENAATPWAPPEILPFIWRSAQGHPQLFTIPITGGSPRRLTAGTLNWLGEPVWMPDGQSILCQAAGDPSADHPAPPAAVFSVRVPDGAMKQLTTTGGLDEQPEPSPDGSRIAWLSKPSPNGLDGNSYRLRRLYVMNPDGSRVKQLTGAFDRDVTRPQWSSDSRTVYFLAEDSGAAHIYAARNDGSVRPVTKGAERLRDFSLAANGRAVSIRASAREAGDAISFAADLPGGVVTLYSPNDHLLADRNIGAVEEMRYESAGHSIQAWLVKPAGFDESKYPLLLDAVDSPRVMHGAEFELRAQILAAAGFVVLLANPRGSPGYGEQFGNLLATRNPEDAAEDLLHAVEAAASRSNVDARRLTISGGLAATWILTHSDRFAAAMLRNPVADRALQAALAQEGLAVASEMGALPWDDPAQYWRHSPLYFAAGITTPALILCRAGDPQARELHFALQARKVDSALVELPREDRPSHTIHALEAEIGWLKR